MNITGNTCSVEDCNRQVYGKKSICRLHDQRIRNNGQTGTLIERHGLRKSPEYRIWAMMKTRCYNKNFARHKWYAGVEVCPEWRKSFKAFYDYIGPRLDSKLTLERIDGSKGYEPGNVKWATREEQARNRRMQSSNTSGYRGVHKSQNTWQASISWKGKHINLGSFKDIELAALAYDAAAIQLYEHLARPNIL